ncbi:IucA/IucC family protein [Natrarchaeobius oligotrophus]|uniref:IucA/IucC family siderophore biosynthesis protein n=1 Tax=Natrarchaeobius chitinivorans TaxID=1679083 RepID=A0A3N6PLQ4_NATCH|nr:IucA/IucC family protein [Natrarchaeobius chitinivorans]RQG99915.1 IucA/IucC family siderophore biosynthesis protein [Natrarchaeobius chitinivorans]
MTKRRRSGPISLRTTAERNALGAASRYARANDLSSPGETAYLEALADARNEILFRLVRGLLRGRPAGLADPAFVAIDRSDSNDGASGSARGPFAIGDPSEPPNAVDDPSSLREALSPEIDVSVDRLRSLFDPLRDRHRRFALVPFPGSETLLLAPLAARHGYDRFRFDGSIRGWSPAERPGDSSADETAVESTANDANARETAEKPARRTTNGGLERIAHPVDLVPLLEREGAFVDGAQAERIRFELSDSVANLALAQLAGDVHAKAVDAIDAGSTLEAIAAGVPAADPASAFERIVTDGHPFHPAGKLRRGMSAADGLAYAPEFADRIDIRFVAIDRAFALESHASGSDRLTERLFETFDGLEPAVEQELPSDAGRDEYAVVPVHPLQYHRTVPERYARQRDDGRVVPIPEFARPATPLLNLRTVVPHEGERTADGPISHLKLAIPVQTTNVVRTLSPNAVSNGPRLTDVVRAIDERESFETLGILAEPAATCYHPPSGPDPGGEAFDDARHLSALLRAAPSAHRLVPDDGLAVVASSLVADAPGTDRPLVCELIDRYGGSVDARTDGEAALAFLERYVAVVVPDQLRLLSAYGIALESHLQNSLVVFDPDDARPVATLVRDLGGIRAHRGRLADRGLSFEPYPNSDLDADGERDCYRKLYYALFQNHLAELVATIVREREVDEADCWRLIRTSCERTFERLRGDSSVPSDRIRRDERALVSDPTEHKALTAMRLRGKRHEYVTSEVANPLARYA